MKVVMLQFSMSSSLRRVSDDVHAIDGKRHYKYTDCKNLRAMDPTCTEWTNKRMFEVGTIKYCNATILTTTYYYRCDVSFYGSRRQDFRLNHEPIAFDSCVRTSDCSEEGRLSDEEGIYWDGV